MSAATDDALEAEAMAAIDAATGDDAGGQVAERDADEAPAAKEPKSQIADTAKKIGWAGKGEWKGDPGEWIDAPEFILKAAGEVLPSMRKSLEDAKEEIKGLKAAVKTSIQHISKARQDGYEQRSRELQTELAQYAAAGDVDNVRAVTKDIVALEKQVEEEVAGAPAADPAFDAWREENPWFGKDKALTAATAALGDEVLAEGYTGKAQIREVDRRLREQFPDKFAKPENPNRRQAAAVEGGTIVRRQGGKTFSDMPKDAQAMCLDLMKLSKAVTKEAFAREHFAAQEQR